MKKYFFRLVGVAITTALTFAFTGMTFGATGVISNGKTMVPVRGVFEELGFTVSWDNATATATISDGTYTVQVPKGKTYFMVNGKSIKPDVPQQVINGSLYLPLRAIGDSVGAATSWDSAKKIAHINYNGKDSYVMCDTSSASSTSTASSTTSSQSGILVKSGSLMYGIYVPLDIVETLGFTNTKSDTSYSGVYFNFKLPSDSVFTEAYNTQSDSFLGLIKTIKYDNVYYVNLGDLANALGIANSLDSTNNIVHINANQHDLYLKCYPKIDINASYPENSDIKCVGVPEIVEHGTSVYGLERTIYTYCNNYDFIKLYWDKLVKNLTKSGYTSDYSRTSNHGTYYSYTKGTKSTFRGVALYMYKQSASNGYILEVTFY